MTGSAPRQLHLVCHSHLDPVWLWDWEEGIAAAVATLRTAVEICERQGDFVFNQNEALLYEWIEDHEPSLLRRIRRLVRQGRWHIMGGWFLQPDCNLPAGEGIVRQIEYGRRYFAGRFGCRPTTAVNFDSFGHSRGLVQILRKTGFDSYIFCRPGPKDPASDLVANQFRWIGFDGSQVVARRAQSHYPSLLGQAVAKIERHLRDWPGADIELIVWGVGNHGGGPSRLDVDAIGAFRSLHPELGLRHSTPEAHIHAARRPVVRLPVWSRDINPWAVGCYTSQVRVKQEYRRLENDLFLTEKLCTYAHACGAAPYPRGALAAAERDLLLVQFHDILPGSSVPTVERSALRLLAHASEALARIRRRPLFAFASTAAPARPGEVAVFVFNPHPYPLRAPVEYEVQMADQNWNQDWHEVVASDAAGRVIPCQLEKEESNLNLDWRKKAVFTADLAPSRVSRFDLRFLRVPARPRGPRPAPAGTTYKLAGGRFILDATVGGLGQVRRGRRRELVRAFQPIVFADSGDPWSVHRTRFNRRLGAFRRLSPRDAADFAGVRDRFLAPVRIVEDGPVRTVIESLWGYRRSRLALSLTLPAEGAWVDVHARVQWSEHSRALKFGITLPARIAEFAGQTMFGVEPLPRNGRECAAQRWVTAKAAGGRRVGLFSDSAYSYSVTGNTLWVTLLRSPYYSALPLPKRPSVPNGRFSPVVDQGIREFRLRLLLDADGRLATSIERLAQAWNEAPLPYCYYPGPPPRHTRTCDQGAILISNPRVLLISARIERDSPRLRIRLYCTAPFAQSTALELPSVGARRRLRFGAFEVKTLLVDPAQRTIRAVPMA